MFVGRSQGYAVMSTSCVSGKFTCTTEWNWPDALLIAAKVPHGVPLEIKAAAIIDSGIG